MNNYLVAVLAGTALGILIKLSNTDWDTYNGVSARDLIGGMGDVGFYTVVAVIGVALFSKRKKPPAASPPP